MAKKPLKKKVQPVRVREKKRLTQTAKSGNSVVAVAPPPSAQRKLALFFSLSFLFIAGMAVESYIYYLDMNVHRESRLIRHDKFSRMDYLKLHLKQRESMGDGNINDYKNFGKPFFLDMALQSYMSAEQVAEELEDASLPRIRKKSLQLREFITKIAEENIVNSGNSESESTAQNSLLLSGNADGFEDKPIVSAGNVELPATETVPAVIPQEQE